MSESPLLSYYRGTGTDHAGRRLVDVLAWDDEQLEQVHDYIQWVFPNADPSRANSAAPLLTPSDMDEFRRDATLQQALLNSFERILRFYGYSRSVSDDGTVQIQAAANWPARSANWLQPFNHNHLRLTRIMKCLAAFGRRADAEALQRALLDLAERTAVRAVSHATARYWREAVSSEF